MFRNATSSSNWLSPRKMTNTYYLSFVTNCAINGFSSYPAIMLNIFTIYAIEKTTTLSNKTLKTLLLSLAASDLGVGLVVQPLYIALLAMEVEHITENNLNYNNIYKAFLLSANMFGFCFVLLCHSSKCRQIFVCSFQSQISRTCDLQACCSCSDCHLGHKCISFVD